MVNLPPGIVSAIYGNVKDGIRLILAWASVRDVTRGWLRTSPQCST
jgi:hypothetical protein